ncbi:MAG: hypothetical protein K2X66_07370 [Cyanobacteria bacterium]|nr:hypothetical protein [Cyanobacteriota bacterium]
MKQPHFPKMSGNAMMEYVLPAVLVLVVAGTVQSLLGMNLSLQQEIVKSQHGTYQNRQVVSAPQGQIDLKSLDSTFQGDYFKANGMTYVKGDTLCLYGEHCLSIPSLAEGAVPEVDGDLGGTAVKQLAQTLDDLATQLEAARSDPTLVNLIRRLANKGHQTGGALTAGGKHFHGEVKCTVANTSCNDLIGANANPGSSISFRDSIKKSVKEFVTVNNQLNKYLKSQPETLPADAKSLIQMASKNIIASGQVESLFTVKGKPINFSDYQVNTATGVTLVSQGRFVQLNANTICNEGHGGKTCLR